MPNEASASTKDEGKKQAWFALTPQIGNRYKHRNVFVQGATRSAWAEGYTQVFHVASFEVLKLAVAPQL